MPWLPTSRFADRPHPRLNRTVFVVAALALVSSCGALEPAPAADADDRRRLCELDGVGVATDVYALEEPGRFSAVAVVGTAVEGSRRDSVPVNVLSHDGRLIASTAPFEMSAPTVVDLATGIQFGVAPPPVFDVELGAQIRVAHGGRPYELVLVRSAAGGDATEGQVVHPPIEPSRAIDDCGGSGETVGTIELDAVYATPVARQVFVISPPEPGRPAPTHRTADRTDGLRVSSSLYRTSPYTTEQRRDP